MNDSESKPVFNPPNQNPNTVPVLISSKKPTENKRQLSSSYFKMVKEFKLAMERDGDL